MTEDKQAFLSKTDIYGNPYINLINQAVDFVLTLNKECFDETPIAHAFIMIGSIISSFTSPLLNDQFPEIVKYNINTMMAHKDSSTMKNVFYHNICLALNYDTIKTLELLKQNGVIQLFLGELLTAFKRAVTYRVRKAIMLGL